MSALAWLLIASAFLILVMVANNSWPAIWARLRGEPLTLMGNPDPGAGAGNTIVPVPPDSQNPPFTITGPNGEPLPPPDDGLP